MLKKNCLYNFREFKQFQCIELVFLNHEKQNQKQNIAEGVEKSRLTLGSSKQMNDLLTQTSLKMKIQFEEVDNIHVTRQKVHFTNPKTKI